MVSSRSRGSEPTPIKPTPTKVLEPDETSVIHASSVSGRVLTKSGDAVCGVTVVAYDRDLRSAQMLGQSTTDLKGCYQIVYRRVAFEGGDAVASGPDLIVLVPGYDDQDPLARRPIRFNAGHDEVIDVIVDPPTSSEFERLSNLVQPLLSTAHANSGRRIVRMPTAGLTADQLTGADVDFIVAKTSCSAEQLQAWISAAVLLRQLIARAATSDLGVDAALPADGWAFFYAVARAERSDTLDSVLSRGPRAWRRIYADGVPHRVPRISTPRLGALVAVMAQLAERSRLDPLRNPGSTVARLWSAAQPKLPTAVALRALQIEQRGTAIPDDYLGLCKEFPASAEQIGRFVRNLHLHRISNGDAALARTLDQRLPPSGHSTAALVDLTQNELAVLVRSAGMQRGFPISQQTAFANALRLRVHIEVEHPVAAVERKLAQTGRFKDPQLATMLRSIRQAPDAARVLLAGDLDGAGAAAAFPRKVADALANLGRFSRSGLVMDAAIDLMNLGIDSPGAAFSYGSDVLAKLLEKRYGAEHATDFYNALAPVIRGGGNHLGELVIGARPPGFLKARGKKKAPKAIEQELPTLRALFGDLDECACDDCESILGLPAYFARLLNLAKTVPAGPEAGSLPGSGPQTAQAVLRLRCPHFFTLPLDCDNARTEVQHVDLALEQLETQVGRAGGSSAAYAELAQAAYPWVLPFDLGAVRRGALLRRLKLDEVDLLSRFASVDPRRLARASLGITAQIQPAISEWSLLTSVATGSVLWRNVWGLPAGAKVTARDPASSMPRTGSPADVLGWASMLIHRTGLTLAELQAVLATSFLGASSFSQTDQCKPSLMQFTGRSAAKYDRLHRFVRLWQKLPGYTPATLDSALTACNPYGTAPDAVELSDSTLQALATLERIRKALDLSPPVAVAFLAPMAEIRTGAAAKTLQEDVFAWLPQPVPNGTLRSRLGPLCASLGAAPRAVDAAIATSAAVGVDQVPDVLSIANLTALYRRFTLARALKVSVPQLAWLQALTGLDPFTVKLPKGAVPDPRKSLSALEALVRATRLVLAGPLSIDKLAAAALPQQMIEACGTRPAAVLESAEERVTLLTALQADLREAGLVGDTLLQRVQSGIEGALGASAATRVVTVLQEIAASTTNVPPGSAIVSALTQGPEGVRPFGSMLPLLTEAEGLSLLAWKATGNKTLEERLSWLEGRLNSRLREAQLLSSAARVLGISAATATWLLTEGLLVDPSGGSSQARVAADVFLNDVFWAGQVPPEIDAVSRADLHSWLHRALRLGGGLLSLLSEEAPGAAALTQAYPASRVPDWRKALAPVAAADWTPAWPLWRELVSLLQVVDPDRLGGEATGKMLRGLVSRSGALVAEDFEPLATRLGLATTEVRKLGEMVVGALSRESMWAPSTLLAIVDLAAQLRISRATVTQLQVLLDDADTATSAAMARQLAEARFPGAHELDAVDDELRTGRRNALCDWLVARWDLPSREALFTRLLIDPDIEPCFRTTRIVQAVNAAQLFLQRILQGLEPGLRASERLRLAADGGELAFRVAEANAKVLLFPQNWLFEELRDDASPAIAALTAELGKGELTQATAFEAYAQFLEDVLVLGQIRVLGMFEDVSYVPEVMPPKRSKRDLYLVGRTANPPYQYYWRVCTDFGGTLMEWLPWRRIDVDLEGDHIMPFVLSGRLCIAWPVIRNQTPQSGQGSNWQVRIGWTRWTGTSWRKQDISRETLDVPGTFSDARAGFTFRLTLDRDQQASALERARIRAWVAQPLLPDSRTPMGIAPITGTFADLVGAIPTSRPSGARLFIGANRQRATDPWPVGQSWFNVVDENCSHRRLEWQLWIRVSLGSGSTWLMLQPGTANVTAALLDIAGQEEQVALGATELWYGAYELDADAAPILPAVTWRAEATFTGPQATTSLRSSTYESTQVFAGSAAFETLIVTIDASAYTMYDLGLQVSDPKDYVCDRSFVLTARGDVKLEQHSRWGLLQSPDRRPWMNGYVEEAAPGARATLQLEWFHEEGHGGDTVFQPSRDDVRFFALPCNASRPEGMLPAVWYYEEGESSAFIDLAPGLQTNGSKFRIYPNGFEEATRYVEHWLTAGELPSLDQVNLFGADRLPTPGPRAANDTLAYRAGKLDVLRQGDLAFDRRMPNANYNWEVHLHAHLVVAQQFAKRGNFLEADIALRRVFDPSRPSSADSPAYFRFRPFQILEPQDDMARQLTSLAKAAGKMSTTAEVAELRLLIDRWQRMPFRPFAIARHRTLAFLWRTLFTWLDIQLAWADADFRTSSRERVMAAASRYIRVKEFLGDQPKSHPGAGRPTITYDGVTGSWDELSNVWIDLAPPPLPVANRHREDVTEHRPNLAFTKAPFDIGYLQFCVPYNDKLDTYWKWANERLFNIRHCLNIDGIEQVLALTDPVIDPELLIRAVASGIRVRDAVAGLYAPTPNDRFSVRLQRALDLANEVRSLGGALLAAREKRDAEALAALRQQHERSLLALVRAVRSKQVEEADANLVALRASRAQVGARYLQYQRLLGRTDAVVPGEGNTTSEESMVGSASVSGQGGALGLLVEEVSQINHGQAANTWSMAAGVAKAVAGAAHATDAVLAALLAPCANSPSAVIRAVAHGASAFGDAFELVSRGWQFSAAAAGTQASHIRRRDEWAMQSNQALRELTQIDKQILATTLRSAIAKAEAENHAVQIDHAQEVDEYLRSKFTNVALYDWMDQQLTGLLESAYRLALAQAQAAQGLAAEEHEYAYNEIGTHWDSGRGGLLSGERLYQDLKRLDVAYLDRREHEQNHVRHVSLARLDPSALLDFRLNGRCTFTVPEWLLDMVDEGGYLRRIKWVSLSIPCVVAPYASVASRLTLLSSTVRVSRDPGAAYVPADKSADLRFRVRHGASTSIVTSSGRDDSGLFELSLRDELKLPFEYRGAESTWLLERPTAAPEYDPDTIKNVILHLRFTSRHGGELLHQAAVAALRGPAAGRPLVHLLSCREDFSEAWEQAIARGTPLSVRLDESILPYGMVARGLSIQKVSTLELLPPKVRDRPAPTAFVERWPTHRDGVADWTEFADGKGIAEIGPVANLQDIFVRLEVG